MTGAVPAGEVRGRLQDAWDSYKAPGSVDESWGGSLPPILFTDDEAEHIASALSTPSPQPVAEVERAIKSVLAVYDRGRGHESQSGMFRLDDIRVLLSALSALGGRA